MIQFTITNSKLCYECQNQIPYDSAFCPICGQRYGHSKKDPNYWLKEATIQKGIKNFDKAVDCLKMAYKLTDEGNYGISIKERLRLPMYLQKAKRNDEAWREFNNLLIKNHEYNKDSPITLLYLDYSTIYDKMRLFLKREKKHLESEKFGFTSEICTAISLAYGVLNETHEDLEKFNQKRLDEFCSFYFQPKEKVPPTETVMRKYLKKLPKVDLGEFIDDINTALEIEKGKKDENYIGYNFDIIGFCFMFRAEWDGSKKNL